MRMVLESAASRERSSSINGGVSSAGATMAAKSNAGSSAAARPGGGSGCSNWDAAGVVLAVLFALAHANNLATRPFWFALAQQIYAVALGILYAYWREKSGSLTAAIIGHNVGDGAEFAIVFFLGWLWR